MSRCFGTVVRPEALHYGYDWVGNRLNPPSGSNALVYNECDQLVSWPGMYAYEYDDAGNLVTKRSRNAQGPIAAEYTYTNDGLLSTAICGGGTTTVSNTWDAMGNRAGMTVGSDEY